MGNNAFLALGSLVQAKLAWQGAESDADAIRAQGEFQQMQSDFNSRLAGNQADDAVGRGNVESNKVGTKVSKIIGSQRASLAAQGLDVDSGSAADVQIDTQRMGALDQLTVKNNAWREAWGFKVEAANASAEGRFAKAAADSKARSTLLTGGLNALGYGIKAGSYLNSGGGGSGTKSTGDTEGGD